MTLPLSGHHARAMALGCMAKGKGVSSRASLIIPVKILVGNTVSSGHHAKAVSSGQNLEAKRKKKVINKERIKAKKGLGKNCIHDRYSSPPTKAPTDNTFPWSSLCLDILRSCHLMLHGLNDVGWKLSSSYGYWPNRLPCLFLQLCIVDQCNIFELLEDMLGILCMYLKNLMMKYD
jgi:hypothetical protein